MLVGAAYMAHTSPNERADHSETRDSTRIG
jgi:hypothetical protein